MTNIELRLVSEEDRSLLRDLMAEYLDEDRDGPLFGFQDEDGTYNYPYFDLYFTEPTRFAFIVMCDEAVAGFAMVRSLRHDFYSIAEFYVRPNFRRSGLGKGIMNLIFAKLPGKRWLISVILENHIAVQFWTHIAESSTEPIELEIIEKRRFRWS